MRFNITIVTFSVRHWNASNIAWNFYFKKKKKEKENSIVVRNLFNLIRPTSVLTANKETINDIFTFYSNVENLTINLIFIFSWLAMRIVLSLHLNRTGFSNRYAALKCIRKYQFSKREWSVVAMTKSKSISVNFLGQIKLTSSGWVH